MTFPILIVCQANVCRSQGASILLNHRLYETQSGNDSYVPLHITSRGTAVRPDTNLCVRALSGQLPQAKLDALRRVMQPQAIVKSDVSDTKLVLTADLRTRSAVVRLDHSARSRAFTLMEAAMLAYQVLAENSPPRYFDGEQRLEWLVKEMDGIRGLIGLPEESTTRSWVRPWKSFTFTGLDIPDAHRDPGIGHDVVRDRLVASINSLAESLRSAFVGGTRLDVW